MKQKWWYNDVQMTHKILKGKKKLKLAVIGSRELHIKVEDMSKYISPQVTELVSGGARGVDSCARMYAVLHNIPIKEFFPDYPRFGRAAPLKRNLQIVEYADEILAFWDGHSRGTAYTLQKSEKMGKKIKVVRIN